MLALDRCYCRSRKPATKHTHFLHFTDHTLCLLCNSDRKPKKDLLNVQTQSTGIKRMAGTWWQMILFWQKVKGAIPESRIQTQEKVTTTKISSCEMQLLLIWGAEFGRSLLLRNYLGCEFLHMSFLGSETFSTPRSTAETRQPHPLPLGARSPCKNTSVHILFHGELPVK